MSNDWNEWRHHVLAEIKRVSKSQNEMTDQLTANTETLIRNTASLEEHVRRTNLLEAKVEHIETHVKQFELLAWLFSKDNLLAKALLAIVTLAVAVITRKYLQ